MPHVRALVRERPIEGGDLPRTSLARDVFGSLWASHVEDLLDADATLSFAEGFRATVSSILLRGRFGDRRLHPASSELIALMVLGRYTTFRSRERAIRNAMAIRQRFVAQWALGRIIVAPVCVYRTPRVGRVNRNPDLLSCTIPGNIADSTAIAIPFGCFEDGLPRAIQLMGPPGSEDTLLDLAERFIASRDTDPGLRPRP